ncbi:phosphatidylinositide phosphatase SAC1 [Galendromus occidentalis]|uniref:Phosphatidylinositol-3-phosphatase SAC1 n=1 Tax=Galendromus occidentalis TaxID=34638 RepID=A0AAJ6QYC1_9ACAR|nr:phosphatidylinositide phosphatase SAC1 [Galendromus occidentalis]
MHEENTTLRRMKLFDSYILHTTLEAYVLQAGNENESLLIDRITGEVKPIPDPQKVLQNVKQSKHVFGAVGTIQLLDSAHLLVITSRTRIGSKPVYRIDGWEMFPLARSDAHLTEEQKINNSTYKQIVMQVLNTPYFYYSTQLDITHSLQRLNRTSSSFPQMAFFSRADSRFVWNQSLVDNSWSSDNRALQFLIPVMHGFYASEKVRLANGKSFEWTIISRRSVQRAGTRFNMRGADSEGNVANFVETEMIVETAKEKSSFVQTRGSIPLLWEQVPDLRYKPPPTLVSGKQEEVVKKHFEQQIVTYGKQVMINLIDQKGPEHALGMELARCLQAISNPQVRYEPFDFHKECKGMRYDRLQVLIDRVASAQDAYGFYFEKDSAVKCYQLGVFRTNCIDCLDRTNVVQSLLAKRSLRTQLLAHDVISSVSELDNDPGLEAVFRNVWADNGDACSLQYAGTGALKSDYTRTGKRSIVGALWDGWNSSIRYYKNNFSDGQRQDGIDLLLGNCRMGLKDPCANQLPPDVFLAPLVLLVLLVLLLLLLLMGEKDRSLFFVLLLWIPSVSFIALKIRSNRMQYIDRPRLKRHGSFRP